MTGALRNLAGDNSWGGVITLGAAATIGCDANNLILGPGGIVNSTFLTTFTGAGNISVTGLIGSGTGGVTKSALRSLTVTLAPSAWVCAEAGRRRYSAAGMLSIVGRKPTRFNLPVNATARLRASTRPSQRA